MSLAWWLILTRRYRARFVANFTSGGWGLDLESESGGSALAHRATDSVVALGLRAGSVPVPDSPPDSALAKDFGSASWLGVVLGVVVESDSLPPFPLPFGVFARRRLRRRKRTLLRRSCDRLQR